MQNREQSQKKLDFFSSQMTDRELAMLAAFAKGMINGRDKA